MNRAADLRKLVKDGGAPRCPACGVQQVFRCDRQGRTFAQCDCGYRAYVERRGGGVATIAQSVLPLLE